MANQKCAEHNGETSDSNSATSEGEDSEDFSDISDDSDIFHLCVDPANTGITDRIGRKTRLIRSPNYCVEIL